MNILITGAAGFIGSHLARNLIWRGDNVIGLDNFNDYYPRKCKEFNVDLVHLSANQGSKIFPQEELGPVYDKLLSYNNKTTQNTPQSTPGTFHFHEADITNLDQLKEIFQNHKIDAIIHLAAMAGVPMSTKNPLLYTKVNVQGTTNLLTLTTDKQKENKNPIKFLFASSSSVYGHREKENFFVTEQDDITKARSVYGATKVAGEVLCHSFHTSFNLKVANIRIFGPIYGPLQRPFGMLHQRAINYTHNNKTLQIDGRDGLKTAKDATYIEDEVKGIIQILDSDFNYEIYNIGTQNPLPIKHWLECIKKAFEKQDSLNPKELKIEIVEADKADVASSADISKAKKLLNYEPTTSMQEGINRQVEVFNLMPKWYKEMQDV